MKRPNINLHIDELVLHGFSAHDRWAIANAVESELSLLFGHHFSQPESSLLRSSNTDRLNAGAFRIDQPHRPQVVGRQIAQAIHGGLELSSVKQSDTGKSWPGNGGNAVTAVKHEP